MECQHNIVGRGRRSPPHDAWFKCVTTAGIGVPALQCYSSTVLRLRFVKRGILLFSTILILAMLPGLCVAQDMCDVRVLAVAGSAGLRPAGGGWLAPVAGACFTAGDLMRTAPGGGLTLQFRDGSLARMDQASMVALVSNPDAPPQLAVVQGRVWARVEKAEQPAFIVSTYNTVAAGNGAEFVVGHLLETTDTVALDGVLVLVYADAQKLLSAGYGMSVGAGFTPEARPVNIDLWNRALDDWQRPLMVAEAETPHPRLVSHEDLEPSPDAAAFEPPGDSSRDEFLAALARGAGVEAVQGADGHALYELDGIDLDDYMGVASGPFTRAGARQLLLMYHLYDSARGEANALYTRLLVFDMTSDGAFSLAHISGPLDFHSVRRMADADGDGALELLTERCTMSRFMNEIRCELSLMDFGKKTFTPVWTGEGYYNNLGGGGTKSRDVMVSFPAAGAGEAPRMVVRRSENQHALSAAGTPVANDYLSSEASEEIFEWTGKTFRAQ